MGKLKSHFFPELVIIQPKISDLRCIMTRHSQININCQTKITKDFTMFMSNLSMTFSRGF